MQAESENYYHVIQNIHFSKLDKLFCLSWRGISQKKAQEEQIYIWYLQTSKDFHVFAKECLLAKSYEYLNLNGIRYDNNARWVQVDEEIIQFVQDFRNRYKLFSFKQNNKF